MNFFTYYLAGIRGLIKQRAAQRSRPLDYSAEELIRNTHSIEKGLCISNPRRGFGHEKQGDMLKLISQLKNSEMPLHKTAVNMAVDALREYLEFHNSQSFSDDFIVKLSREIKSFESDSDQKRLGGTTEFRRSEIESIDVDNAERLFNTRHSIRDFSEQDINDEILTKALLLAGRAPSACNRQGVRAYVICGKRLEDLSKELPDIGGFANNAKRIIAITGKVNAYRPNEINQYIVSASMYAAYLTLTLHLYGMGACVVQRPVIWTKSWERFRKKWNISDDEQIVCMIAVGNLKESCKVPISNRLGGEDVILFIR